MRFKQHQNSNAEIDLNNMIQYLTNNNIIDTDTQTLGTVKGYFYHMYNQLVNNQALFHTDINKTNQKVCKQRSLKEQDFKVKKSFLGHLDS